MTDNIKGLLQSYREGFQDGWNLAMKEAKKEVEKVDPNMEIYKALLNKTITTVLPPSSSLGTCPVCGKSGIRHEVCYSLNCPSRVTSLEIRP